MPKGIPNKKLVDEIIEDEIAEEINEVVIATNNETIKKSGEKKFSITLKANCAQFNGEVTRTFDNEDDAEAWQKRYNAVEVKQ